ncbi:hypothetical protein GpartN1_g3186.t1 [Galdieria partita]|uniref:AB hydrolase-1 domain-containing protein n=1 Tax=Galdieria partita TaxID=83374 RepID=A0A9C7UQB5_9RHOD|nr:hypothetical protein GpartN1_g3186.t1 [Galdieria partita]
MFVESCKLSPTTVRRGKCLYKYWNNVSKSVVHIEFGLRCFGYLKNRKGWRNNLLHMSYPSTSTKRDENYHFPCFQPSKKGILFTLLLTSAVFFIKYKLSTHRLRSMRLFYSLLFACCAFGVSWLVSANMSYCQSLQSPEAIVDSTSQFIPVKGAVIHFQQYIPVNKVSKDGTWGMILLHGFGSWLYTYHMFWRFCVKELDCTFLAFDRPAFGFSSRPRDKKYYSQSFAIYLVGFFMDRLSQLGISKHVIVGHSMGGLTAALAALKYRHGVRALVLIAAAIPTVKSKGSVEEEFSGRLDRKVLLAVLHGMRLFVVHVWIRLLVGFVSFVIQPLMYVSLSLLVSQEMFWRRGLSVAWYSIEKLTDKVIEQYRLPTLVKHWQRGLIDFVVANRNKTPFYPTSVSMDEQKNIVDQLSKSNIPILLIHGKEDRVIPLKRSLELAANLPQARLVVIPQCGHVPQEEQPQRVWDVIREFLYSSEEI